MVSNISLDSSCKSTPVSTHFEAVCRQPAMIGSCRSSLRRLNYAIGSSAQIQDTAEYLALEKEADADWEQGFQSDWVDGYGNVYREWGFFKDIANRYAEASSIAMDLGHIPEAVRIMEKEALVYSEKLDGLPKSIDLLLKAWQLSDQGAEPLLQKLLILTDRNIASNRTENEFHVTGLIHALLLKAKILAETGSSLEQSPLYEEAGELCLRLDAEGTAFGHLSAALIAGLCFEKSEKMKDRAGFSYEKALEMKQHILTIFREEGVGLPREQKMQMELYKLIYFAPACLQTSLASLKCGNKDAFVEIINSQVSQFISCIHLLLADREAYSEIGIHCIDYMRALIHVSEMCLGDDVSGLSKVKEDLQKIPKFKSERSSDGDQQQMEEALLAIYTAPQEISVDEMVKRLEDRRLLSP